MLTKWISRIEIREIFQFLLADWKPRKSKSGKDAVGGMKEEEIQGTFCKKIILKAGKAVIMNI